MQLFESVSKWLADMPVVRRARNGPRVDVGSQVLVRVVGSDETNAALLRDLSTGGACIRCDLPLGRGDLVWIGMTDDVLGAVEFTAAVVAVRANELGFFSDFGLRIVQLSLDSARTIGALVNQRLTAKA